MTPQVGFEPTTRRLTVVGSAAELLRNIYSPKGKRVTGIEPVTRAWKARMLPLHHTRRSGLTWERRWWWSLPMPSDSRRTRTFDRLLRRQLLYPTELASQVVVPIAANPEPPRGLPQLTMPALFRRSYNQQSHHTGL